MSVRIRHARASVAAGDAGAFILNIISSVFIISGNKRLMGSPPNFNFRYVVTLNALHYITTSIWTRVAKVIGLAKQEESSKAPAHVPLQARHRDWRRCRSCAGCTCTRTSSTSAARS